MKAQSADEARSARHVLAVCVIVIRDGRVLAMRRASHKVGAGLWETVSGRVHLGEQPFDAACREASEETGLALRVHPRPVDAYCASRGTEPMGVIVYRADTTDAGDVVPSNEHDAFEWLAPAEFAARSTLTRLAEAVFRACGAEAGI